MLISNQGVIIRLLMDTLRIQRRNTQGVHLMRLTSDNEVVAIACLGEKIVDEPPQKGKPSKSKTNAVQKKPK